MNKELLHRDGTPMRKYSSSLINELNEEMNKEDSQDPGLISTSDNTTEWVTEVGDGVIIHQNKPKSIDAVELLYNIVKKEVDELNKDR